MTIYEYITEVQKRIKEAHDNHNQEEYIRLIKLLHAVLTDHIDELTKEAQ